MNKINSVFQKAIINSVIGCAQVLACAIAKLAVPDLCVVKDYWGYWVISSSRYRCIGRHKDKFRAMEEFIASVTGY